MQKGGNMKRLYWIRECMYDENHNTRKSSWIKVQTDWDLNLLVKSTVKRGHWIEWKQRFTNTGWRATDD